ncbi:hypothetical protein KAI32_00590 [Candidatus Pacearchaeota archaeon]|nr:hypothetical protein [Candidatus Pacearchaeota archaeon]
MNGKFLMLLGFLVLSFGFVSADTAIAGKIYNTTLGSDFVEGANVTVTCNGFFAIDVSENDGSYGVDFLSTECNSSHTYVVSAEKGDYFGSESASDIDEFGIGGVDVAIIEKVVIGTTTISGIIYNLTNDVIEDASVTVTCNYVDASVTLSNIDGSYSVDFSESVCNISHVFSVFAEKGEYNGTNESLNVIDGTVANVVIEKAEAVTPPIVIVPATYSSGGSGGGSTNYICEEWSECIDGLQTKACNNNSITSRSCIVEIEEEVEELGTSEIGLEDEELEDVAPTFFSMITGAVTGAAGTAGGIAAISVFIILALGGFVAIRIRKKNKITKKSVLKKKD